MICLESQLVLKVLIFKKPRLENSLIFMQEEESFGRVWVGP